MLINRSGFKNNETGELTVDELSNVLAGNGNAVQANLQNSGLFRDERVLDEQDFEKHQGRGR